MGRMMGPLARLGVRGVLEPIVTSIIILRDKVRAVLCCAVLRCVALCYAVLGMEHFGSLWQGRGAPAALPSSIFLPYFFVFLHHTWQLPSSGSMHLLLIKTRTEHLHLFAWMH